jgi:tetratricopeptide (TPR) repeat protein
MEIHDRHAAEIAAVATAKRPLGIAWQYICLAHFMANTQQEHEAVQFVRQAADTAKLLTDSAASAQALYGIGIIQARLRDAAGYRATCKALVDVDFASASDKTKVQTIFTWCLAPNALDDTSLVVKRAEEYAAHNSLGQRHGDLFQWGAALYRAGQHDPAAQLLEQSIDVYPSNPPPPPGAATINYQRLFLAMTQWRQGRRDEARQLLAETQATIEKEFQPPSPDFETRIHLEVLRREAEALIERKAVNKAVENMSRTSDEAKQ